MPLTFHFLIKPSTQWYADPLPCSLVTAFLHLHTAESKVISNLHLRVIQVDKGLLDANLAAYDRHELLQRTQVGAGKKRQVCKSQVEASSASLSMGRTILLEIYRVLKPGGLLVIVSYERQVERVPFLTGQGLAWKVDVLEYCQERDWHMYRLASSPWSNLYLTPYHLALE